MPLLEETRTLKDLLRRVFSTSIFLVQWMLFPRRNKSLYTYINESFPFVCLPVLSQEDVKKSTIQANTEK